MAHRKSPARIAKDARVAHFRSLAAPQAAALQAAAAPGPALAWDAIARDDFPVVQAVVLLIAVIYIILTLLADVLNALLDPRIRVR